MSLEESFFELSKIQIAKEIIRLVKCNHEWYEQFKEEIGALLELSLKCRTPIETLFFWQMVIDWNCSVGLNDDSGERYLMPCMNLEPIDILQIEVRPKIEIQNMQFYPSYLLICYNMSPKSGENYWINIVEDQYLNGSTTDRNNANQILSNFCNNIFYITESEVSSAPSDVLEKILKDID